MRTYREIEATLDNEVAEYKMGIDQRLGTSWSGAAPRLPGGLEHPTDTPETDIMSCSRCGEMMEAIDLDSEDFCPDCHARTWSERDQERLMNREEYS